MKKTEFVAAFQEKHTSLVLRAAALNITPDYAAAFAEYEILCDPSADIISDMFPDCDWMMESAAEITPAEAVEIAVENLHRALTREVNRAAYSKISADAAQCIAKAMQSHAVESVNVGDHNHSSWRKFLDTWNSYQDESSCIDFVGDFAIE